jgi:hypothetical protein
MPISYEIDEVNGWVRMVGSGVITDDEVLAYRQSLVADPRFHPSMKLLSDMRGIESVQVTAGGIRRLVHEESTHAQQLAARRLAIVTDSPVAYGMARMYQMLAENAGGAIQVFRRVEEATAWLLSEAAEDRGAAPGGPRDH